MSTTPLVTHKIYGSPFISLTYTINIHSRPSDIWPWLVQVGCIDASRATHAALHRWRYALVDPETATGTPFLSVAEGLAATGDWCSASRVEDAWHSGRRLAADIVAALDGKQASPAHDAMGA